MLFKIFKDNNLIHEIKSKNIDYAARESIPFFLSNKFNFLEFSIKKMDINNNLLQKKDFIFERYKIGKIYRNYIYENKNSKKDKYFKPVAIIKKRKKVINN